MQWNNKYKIVTGSGPIPIFSLQQVIKFIKSEQDYPNKSAVGKIYGSPCNNKWKNMRDLFNYLISDITKKEHESFYTQFIINKNDFKHNNQRKLKSIDTIYESGYEYQRWILIVCIIFMFIFIHARLFFQFTKNNKK